MVSKLIPIAMANADVLRRYVIVQSCRRMNRRLQHATLSQPYLTSLLEIKTFMFPEHDTEGKPTNGKVNNDASFISNLLPRLEAKLCIKIPNLN